MLLVRTCRTCKQEFVIPVTDEQLRKWQSGMLIQKAMPELPVDLRELLISGICGECFDKIFRGEE